MKISYEAVCLVGFILLICFHFVDLFVTDQLLSAGGTEFNPVARFLYNRYGTKGLLLLKITLAAALSVMFFFKLLSAFFIWFATNFYLYMLIIMAVELRKQILLNKSREIL